MADPTEPGWWMNGWMDAGQCGFPAGPVLAVHGDADGAAGAGGGGDGLRLRAAAETVAVAAQAAAPGRAAGQRDDLRRLPVRHLWTDRRRRAARRHAPPGHLRQQRPVAGAGDAADHVHRRGVAARLLVALPDAVQAGPPDRHLPVVRQRHHVAAGHVHDAQLADPRAALFLLRIPGLGHRVAPLAALARLFPLPLGRRPHRDLEEHVPDKGHLRPADRPTTTTTSFNGRAFTRPNAAPRANYSTTAGPDEPLGVLLEHFCSSSSLILCLSLSLSLSLSLCVSGVDAFPRRFAV